MGLRFSEHLAKIQDCFAIRVKLLASLSFVQADKSLPCRLVALFHAGGCEVGFLGLLSLVELVQRKT